MGDWGICHWILYDTYFIKPRRGYIKLYYAQELYLIHRNKHKEVAKMRKQRNTSQMNEENKTPEKN